MSGSDGKRDPDPSEPDPPRDRLFVPTEELRLGWHKTLPNLKPWLWLGLLAGFVGLLLNVVNRPAGNDIGRPLLGLCLQLVQVAITLAGLRVALRLADDRPVGDLDPKVLLAGYLPFLFTHLLFGLIVAGGLILLIVPGVWWAITYGFAPFLSAAEGYDPVAALRESRRLTTGHRREVFVFGLLCLAVNALGALAFGLGLLVTVPTTMIAAAHVLRRLQAHAPGAPTPRYRVPQLRSS